MVKLTFETLSFKEEQDKIKVVLLKQFYFYIDKEELAGISSFEVKKNGIIFEGISLEKAEKKFNLLIAKGFGKLRSVITNNPAIYIHQNSGIPLIGNVSFGLVYRNTSLIEIKPMTGCNLNCIYCSVGEGIHSKKTDFVIEKDYLVEEFRRLLELVDGSVEAHIGTHGEPFLYGDIISLVKDLNGIKQVKIVSLNTNGTLLNKEIIDELSKLKKVRLNISLNTLDPETAKIMAGIPYNLKKVIKIIKYTQGKVDVLLTPLLVPGYNDSKMEELVKFAKENSFRLGIQNFLTYKTGRNPAKPWSWEKFYALLKEFEKKYEMVLVISPKDFEIKYAKKLDKPFLKSDVVLAEIVCLGRFLDSRIAAAENRSISLPNCSLPVNKKVRVKIVRDKHNIFTGKVV
jgi:uncharacterized Fe-S cluster-containing radical SAM superfamily enzyme